MFALFSRAAGCLLCALALGGCASLPSAPKSVIDGNPPSIQISSRLHPLEILSVDRKINSGGPVLLAPGLHSVVLRYGVLPKNDGHYTMLIAPCTRYFLAAELDTVTARTWQMTIVSTEPVGGCDPDEERKKAGI
jgi:hypothetical protein